VADTAKRPPQTDPRAVSFADAVHTLSLLALGDRSKSTDEERRRWGDALVGVFGELSHFLGIDSTAPLLPTLEVAREVLKEARAWRRCDRAADALAEKGDDASADESYQAELASKRMMAALDALDAGREVPRG
jgi:hypothetical protein